MKFNLNFGEDIYYNISIEHLDNYVYLYAVRGGGGTDEVCTNKDICFDSV